MRPASSVTAAGKVICGALGVVAGLQPGSPVRSGAASTTARARLFFAVTTGVYGERQARANPALAQCRGLRRHHGESASTAEVGIIV